MIIEQSHIDILYIYIYEILYPKFLIFYIIYISISNFIIYNNLLFVIKKIDESYKINIKKKKIT